MFFLCPLSGVRDLEHLGCLATRMLNIFMFILNILDASDRKPNPNTLKFPGGGRSQVILEAAHNLVDYVQGRMARFYAKKTSSHLGLEEALLWMPGHGDGGSDYRVCHHSTLLNSGATK